MAKIMNYDDYHGKTTQGPNGSFFTTDMNKGATAIGWGKPANVGAYVPKTSSSSGSSGGGRKQSSSSSGSYTTYEPEYKYNQALLDALNGKKNAAISSLQSQYNAAVGELNANRDQLKNTYQNYRNQSEVERYKAQGRLREAQANRGALNSGIGRQETLDLQTNYGNNLNNINIQEATELNALDRQIAALRAQYENNMAQLGYDYDMQIAQAQANRDAYAPSEANYSIQGAINAAKTGYANAQNSARQAAAKNVGAVGNSQIGKNAVVDTGQLSGSDNFATVESLLKTLTRDPYTPKEGLMSALQIPYEKGLISEEDVALLRQKYGF